MSPRPNPTQTKLTDALAWERTMQGWLRPGYVVTVELFETILRDPFGSHVARVAVQAWIEAYRDQIESRFRLTAEQGEELDRFLDDKGPRPHFVPAAAPAGYLTTEESTARASELAVRREQEPKPDPSEPGRYVQPSGRFALPGREGFEPDSR